MKLLLDTHALMWWDSDPGQLSPMSLAARRDPANEVWFSAVNIWEMVIKIQAGKLIPRLPLADIIAHQQANGLRVLAVTVDHVLGVERLPSPHKDLFDRLLAAQAIAEDAELVTADHIFAQYPVRVLW